MLVLILAGGVVRSTGSGMGCPDWPKCFGRYIPPVNEAQLPSDYRTSYQQKQAKKNQHFAKILDAFGYISLAAKVRNESAQNKIIQEQFNPLKTWTEYINRLIGAVTGIFLLATAALSFSYKKSRPAIIFLSIFNLVLVAIQAWLGSVVVSTNLVPWIVTVHMLLALAILALAILTLHLAKITGNKSVSSRNILLKLLAVLAIILDLVQITLGTEVREKIDQYAAKLNGNFRMNWVNGATKILTDHKNMALAVIAVNVLLFLLVRKNFAKSSALQQLMSSSILIVMMQAFAGAVLTYWGLPPAAQIIHLVLASLLFGVQFYLLLHLFRAPQVITTR